MVKNTTRHPNEMKNTLQESLHTVNALWSQHWRQMGWALMTTVIVLSFLYDHTPLFERVWCVSILWFDLPCPGCGLTRAFCAMADGDLIRAFRFHTAGPLLYFATLYVVVMAPIQKYGFWQGFSGPKWRWLHNLFWHTTTLLYLLQAIRVFCNWWGTP